MEQAGPSNGVSAGSEDDLKPVLDAVVTALAGMDFGSVLLKVHQGKVVSIETSVKLRITD
ncbi:MAG: YezD family protein [Actinomycetota bacterium]|nr:YezD family protein [Actinomycetota bacterium]